MADIVLATHNARWLHSAFGLRCLRANLGPLRERCEILEFGLDDRAADAAERILHEAPRIVGIGVYVWNAEPALQLVRTLKSIAPGCIVVVGGPEVSHESERQPLCALADHVVRGEADLEFAALCRRLLDGEAAPHTIDATPPHFEHLASPYGEYTDQDVAHRVVYVESSRGCPFTCSFCLSALEVPVRRAPLVSFLGDMERLLARGLRHFKFVDRTFNLGIAHAVAVLRFFREHHVPGLFLHFELVPDRLPDELRAEIAAMPAGSLQFEVGVQTLDGATGARIARRQDVGRLEQNLRWLRAATDAHIHADLIVGLPGEDEATFARGFDRLWALGPHEIQVGVLKRLRGAPITQLDGEAALAMRYSAAPPYEVLATAAVPFPAMQRMKRFARYWDIVANSGNWRDTLALLLTGNSPYAAFEAFAGWLFVRVGRTSGIALGRLGELLFEWLVQHRGVEPGAVAIAMVADHRRCGRRDRPEYLEPFLVGEDTATRSPGAKASRRQQRHGTA